MFSTASVDLTVYTPTTVKHCQNGLSMFNLFLFSTSQSISHSRNAVSLIQIVNGMIADLAIVWHFSSLSLSSKQINRDSGVNTNMLNSDSWAIEIYEFCAAESK